MSLRNGGKLKLFQPGAASVSRSRPETVALPHKMLDRPIDGTLWVGPPFVSLVWQALTAKRDPGSPAWLPRLTMGEVVPFTDGRQSWQEDARGAVSAS